MNVRGFAIALSAVLMATSVPGLADAAGRGGPGTGARSGAAGPRSGPGHHHGHRVGARVGVGVGIGLGLGYGGFYDPFYDPFFDPYYDYGYPAYGYVPQPAVPCTPADVPKTPPTSNPFSPDFAYDRIDAARCTPEAVAEAQAAAAAQAAAQQEAPAQAPGAQQAPAYYFCHSANAYYPNVKECAEGWQPVSPRPPGT